MLTSQDITAIYKPSRRVFTKKATTTLNLSGVDPTAEVRGVLVGLEVAKLPKPH